MSAGGNDMPGSTVGYCRYQERSGTHISPSKKIRKWHLDPETQPQERRSAFFLAFANIFQNNFHGCKGNYTFVFFCRQCSLFGRSLKARAFWSEIHLPRILHCEKQGRGAFMGLPFFFMLQVRICHIVATVAEP